MAVKKIVVSQDREPEAFSAGQCVPGLKLKARAAAFWRSRGYLLAGLDVIVIFAGFIIAYYGRFYSILRSIQIPGVSYDIPPLTPYIKASLLIAAAWLFLLWRDGAYRNDFNLAVSLRKQLREIVATGCYAIVFLMVVSFMYRQLLLSRGVYILGFIISLLLLSLVRVCFQLVERHLSIRRVVVERVLVLGEGPRTESLVKRIQERDCSTRVVGRLHWPETAGHGQRPDGNPEDEWGDEIKRLHALTRFDKLLLVPDGKFLLNNPGQRETLMHILQFCEQKGIAFFMVPDVLDVAITRTEFGDFGGVPLIRLQDATQHMLYAVGKRIMDLAISSFVLVAGSPLWLLIAVLVKATSKGPAIYVQERVGANGRKFSMYKFRSMAEDAEERLADMVDFDDINEPVFKISNDPRVTPLGRFLRRTSLDEIPQLINVLRGEMSLVGPRPEEAGLVSKYNVWQMRRLKAKPGITGYQQVVSRGDPSLAKRIELDLYYLKHQGFWFDLFILLRTTVVVLRGDGLL
ncbi:MAG: sugar transferase [Desulfobacterales bacterium]|nr:sugar transferase [Desulfobacterales bacterium]